MEPKKQLYSVITNGIGQHYVIAESFDDAARQVKNWADAEDYGFETDRIITTVTLVAPSRATGLMRDVFLFINGEPQ